jgi:hypothetical protein
MVSPTINLLTKLCLALIFSLSSMSAGVNRSAGSQEPAAEHTPQKRAYRFSDVETVVVIGDSHGAYANLLEVLKKAAMVDEHARWVGGNAHLVSLGDFLGRGAESRKIMDLLMSMQTQAREQGGWVHVLLGNYELMNMVADTAETSVAEFHSYLDLESAEVREAEKLRYEALPAEQRQISFNEKFPPGFFGHQLAMSNKGKYGAWLRTLPYMIVINDIEMVHGGLPEMVAGLGLEGTNQRLGDMLRNYETSWDNLAAELALKGYTGYTERNEIAKALPESVAGDFVQAAQADLFNPSGPVWAWEESLCVPLSVEDTLLAALDVLGVKRVVVGHAVTPDHKIGTRFDGRVVMVDTGMFSDDYRGGRGSALVVKHGTMSAYYTDQEQAGQVMEMPRRVGARPGGLTDDELEQFLLTADIVELKDVGVGVTHPVEVVLEKDGLELSAIFKDVDFKEVRKGRRIEAMGDSWRHEVAAYGVDRLLGLELVPVTVARTVNGKQGSLQFWVNRLVNQIEILEDDIEVGGWCPMGRQYELIKVFDALIYNQDRTRQNMTFDSRYWRAILIDHSRSFESNKGFPAAVKKNKYLLVRPAMAKRLAGLTEENLQVATHGYLKPIQVRSILARRDRLLKSCLAD